MLSVFTLDITPAPSHYPPSMLLVAAANPRSISLMLLLGGAVVLYAASMCATRLLAGSEPANAGRRAVGHGLRIAAVGLIAALMRRPEIAIGVVFACCVACLSLMMGILAFFSPLE